jgi:signal transduction histidine kinase
MATPEQSQKLLIPEFPNPRRIRSGQVFGRITLYGLLLALVAGGYALLVAGLGLVAGDSVLVNSPILAGLLFFAMALLMMPLRDRLKRAVDGLFDRKVRSLQQQVESFGASLMNQSESEGVSALLRQVIGEALQPNQFHVFVVDPHTDQFLASKDENGQPTSELRFNSSSPLVQHLKDRAQAWVIERTGLTPRLQTELNRIQLLQADVLAPLSGQKGLIGWLALGKRSDGQAYTALDLDFIEVLARQTALAIERTQMVTSMEKRMREMDVLGRVAQGVNVTVALDDIFELIYAQTTQIIRADDFGLALVNPQNEIVQVFAVEGDERLPERESVVLQASHSLEVDVVRTQRPLLTEDYQKECRQRNLLVGETQRYAWMSVPLNAGAETIGALSLGLHDPTKSFTSEQVVLLQAIADQVAGAIVKARLLEVTERRARQLTTLNEVTRQLTSTLDLELLLRNILQSAVEILNCEAGSLLLVDEQSDELVFRVTTGPVAADLVNKRMKIGTGAVGKAVTEQRSLIINDVSSFPDWFQRIDQQTGFVTRDLLVVPLILKDRVNGVIEVVNRRDRSHFTIDDETLLSAFAAQAAVAMENARLYTLTDQALAARVEELSVMQRIDRELNNSLDVSRAMRITLEWAMRQSGADAGLVGVLHEDGLRITASEGYTDELTPFSQQPLSLEEYELVEAVQSGLPRRELMDEMDQRLLHYARSRTMIPIRREESTIGLLYLESASPDLCPEEVLGFLARLSDHASIAIANAQLYAAVEAANVAKSEFVSFVAHELKNPMTSIKGYTELLAAKAVGPINDAQANFLGTIRGNIERMNTLVSDLNDLSKIEAGRLRLEFKAMKLGEVMEEVARSVRKQIEEKTQVLTLQLAADLPPVWADRVRLAQILVNLVSNAHKYTEASGEIVVGAERAANQWDATGAAEVVHIWIRDNGIGISEEDQKKIFQKFFRSEDPKTREVTGTGLGLNITRSLVEMQGGKIWFESEFRKGTTFHFTVPVAEQ